jgi:hypothetical protein
MKIDNQTKPNLFIVGAPKCGTTSMYKYLKQHPEIFMSEPKEPRYLCTDFREEAKQNNSQSYFPIKTRKGYKKLFAGAQNHKIIGEASPIYLYSETAVKNIKNLNKNAKIIIMVRDPVKQVYSWYYQSIQTGMESAMSFEKALKLEPARKKGRRLPTQRFPSSYFYREIASYGTQIDRFKKAFSSQQIKTILLQELKEDPGKTYRNVLNFLEVNNTGFAADLSRINPGRVPRSMWLNNTLKHPGKKVRSIIKTIFPKSFLQALVTGLNSVNLSKKSRPPLKEKTQEILKENYKNEVRKTARIIDKNVIDIWGY